jgi:hypothetical protein
VLTDVPGDLATEPRRPGALAHRPEAGSRMKATSPVGPCPPQTPRPNRGQE